MVSAALLVSGSPGLEAVQPRRKRSIGVRESRSRGAGSVSTDRLSAPCRYAGVFGSRVEVVPKILQRTTCSDLPIM